MPYIPTLPSIIPPFDPVAYAKFFKNLVDKSRRQKLIAIEKMISPGPGRQLIVDRYYLEFMLLLMLRPNEKTLRKTYSLFTKSQLEQIFMNCSEFSAVFQAVYRNAPESVRISLAGALNAGIENFSERRGGLISLAHECHMLHWLTRQGFAVSCTEWCCDAQYDFTAYKPNFEVHVDCKSFTSDKGRIIPVFDADRIHEAAFKGDFARLGRPSPSVLVLHFEQRPKVDNSLLKWVSDKCSTVDIGQNIDSDKIKINRISPDVLGEWFFENLISLPFDYADRLAKEVSSKLGIVTEFCYRTPSPLFEEKPTLFVFTSNRQSRWAKKAIDEMKEAAERQISTGPYSMLAVRIGELSEGEHSRHFPTASEPVTSYELHEMAMQVFESRRGSKLSALLFVSKFVRRRMSVLGPSGNTQEGNDFRTFHFVNKKLCDWEDVQRRLLY